LSISRQQHGELPSFRVSCCVTVLGCARFWMGSVAVGALTASVLSLFHDIEATVMILMWNLGPRC
jgi:hypothetical protein